MSDPQIKDLQARLEKLEEQMEDMTPLVIRAAMVCLGLYKPSKWQQLKKDN